MIQIRQIPAITPVNVTRAVIMSGQAVSIALKVKPIMVPHACLSSALRTCILIRRQGLVTIHASASQALPGTGLLACQVVPAHRQHPVLRAMAVARTVAAIPAGLVLGSHAAAPRPVCQVPAAAVCRPVVWSPILAEAIWGSIIAVAFV